MTPLPSSWIDALEFIDPKWTDGELMAVVAEPLRFQTGCLGDRNRVIEIPTKPHQTVTDFASIPRMVRWLIAKFGAHARSAVFHDYLFQSGILTWSESNKVMLEIMKIDGVGFWTRQTIYRGLRIGSYPTWRAYRTGKLRPPHIVLLERVQNATAA